MDPPREEPSTTTGKSFQDNASREGATQKAPSLSDHHGLGFHLENSPKRREEGEKSDAFNKVSDARPRASPSPARKRAKAFVFTLIPIQRR